MEKDLEDSFGLSSGLAMRHSVPCWVYRQVALMAMVPVVGCLLMDLLV